MAGTASACRPEDVDRTPDPSLMDGMTCHYRMASSKRTRGRSSCRAKPRKHSGACRGSTTPIGSLLPDATAAFAKTKPTVALSVLSVEPPCVPEPEEEVAAVEVAGVPYDVGPVEAVLRTVRSPRSWTAAAMPPAVRMPGLPVAASTICRWPRPYRARTGAVPLGITGPHTDVRPYALQWHPSRTGSRVVNAST